MDRGGLIHISDNLFFLFAAMEAEVKSHFSIKNPSLLKDGLKENILSGVLENEGVLFYWSMLAANWEKKEAENDSGSLDHIKRVFFYISIYRNVQKGT